METNTSQQDFKICNKCLESKSINDFYKKKQSRDGLYHHCKSCHSILKASWYKNNAEKVKADSAEWYKQNSERRKKTLAAWKEKNSEKYKSYQAEWYKKSSDEYKSNRKISYSLWAKNNPEKVQSLVSARRARKLKATPKWFGEFDKLVIAEAHDLARLRLKSTGIFWEVDHMIPMKATHVCGLHVWNNIQVIPSTLNSSKNNKILFTEHLEWLSKL